MAPRARHVWTALAAAALAAGLCAGSLGHQLTFDDRYIVAGNPLVTGNGGPAAILTSHYWAGTDRAGSLYRPLTIATYWLQHRLSGPSPGGYHLVNLLLHAAVTALVALALARPSGSAAAASLAAVLFAVHPIHVEAVAAVVGRADLLAALFALAAWRIRERTVPALALFACALLSKESAVALPALLVVEDLWRGQRRGVWRRWLPWIAVLAAWLALRSAVLGGWAAAGEAGPFAATPAAERVLTAVSVLGRYLRLMFWPATLSADYSFDQVPIVRTPLDAGFLLGAACLLIGSAAAWRARRRMPALSMGLLIFFVALLPVSNLLFGIGVVMAERLLYLPSAGLCLAAAALIQRAKEAAGARGPAVAAGLAALAIVPLAARTWTRCADWRDQATLFEATVRAAPRSALAHFGLGAAYQEAGRAGEAEAEYRASLAIDPANPETLYNLARLMDGAGRLPEAEPLYREALRADPAHARARNNLGMILEKTGRKEEAEREYRLAIEEGGAGPDPAFHLATMLESQGRIDEAIEAYRQALRLQPGDVQALNNLGRALLSARRTREAIDALQRAVDLSPGALLPQVNLASAWLAAGDAARAADLAQRALAAHPDDDGARRVLQAARARLAGGRAAPDAPPRP